MATIDSKWMIDTLIENDGYFEGDPRVYSIVEYTNAYGNKTWGVTWVNEMNKNRYLQETEFVRNPRIIWKVSDANLNSHGIRCIYMDEVM